MRGRLSFALTACTILFTFEALGAVLASGFAILHDVTAGGARLAALLLLLLPLAALGAPVLQWTRLGRYNAVAGTAMVAALARVPMSIPALEYRLVAGSIVLAAGAAFLSCAVGFLERRSVAAGVGAAVVLDQLLRLAGWSWSISLRPWWVLPQMLVSGLVILLAVLWLRMPAPAPEHETSFERRAGGLRLRGALALALLLFLDLNVLARAEVATRVLGVRYEAAAVVLAGVGAAAVLVLLAGQGPLGRYRIWSVFLALLAALPAVAVWYLDGWFGVALMAAGHASAILLAGRALVPSSGRRKGGTTSAAFAALVALNAAWVATFLTGGRGSVVAIAAVAGVLLGLCITAMPRPLATQPPLRRRLYAVLAGVAAVSVAGLLAARERPGRADVPAGAAVQVAAVVHRWGFDDAWRHEPGLLVEHFRHDAPDVLVLGSTVSAMPAAYGTDLALYLSRRVGLRVYHAPGRHPLHGAAVLTRVHAYPLPHAAGAVAVAVPRPADTLNVIVGPAAAGAAVAPPVVLFTDSLMTVGTVAGDVGVRTLPRGGYRLLTATIPSRRR